jgi:hypothetical protein
MIIEHISVQPDSGCMAPWKGLKQKYCDKLNLMNPHQLFRCLDRINSICKEHGTILGVSIFIEYTQDPFAQNLTQCGWKRHVAHLGAFDTSIPAYYLPIKYPIFTGYLDKPQRKVILVDFNQKP